MSDESSEAGPASETGIESGSGAEATSDVESKGGSDSEAASEAETTDAGDDGADDWTPAWLVDLRADDARRHAALVVAAMLGLGAAWVHWLGLFVAGALVGLASESWPRALAAGLGMGVLVLLVQVGASPVMEAGELAALAPASYVTVAAGLLFPAWGSLVRGVV